MRKGEKMNILLPKDGFKVYDKDGNVSAEVKKKTLYLYRPQDFKKIQYELTHEIYGDTCMFCHKAPATTMDHRIPQAFGGPTITNNLYPACKNCNETKASMYEDEFAEYLELPDKKSRREYVKSLKEIQESRKFGTISALPDEWLEKECRSTLLAIIYVDEPLGEKHAKCKRHHVHYKKNKDALVYSKNYVLLDGFTEFFVGKEENRKNENHIWLENVIVVFSYPFKP